MKFVLVRVAAAITISAALVSCGFPSDDAAERINDNRLPEGLRTEQNVPVPESATERATIWLIDGERLVSVRHDVAKPAGPGSVIANLAAGPSALDQQRGLRSAVPDPGVIDTVTATRGTATVAVSTSFAEIPTADQLFAVGQLVLTLTDVPGVGAVMFTLGESPIAVPVPTGETTDQPVYREQYLPMQDDLPSTEN